MTTIDPTRAPSAATVSSGAVGDPRATGATTLLPDPNDAVGGEVVWQLARLLTQADQQDRDASRRMQSLADQAATREENQRVQQMEASAGSDEMQGVMDGIGRIAGGALTVGGAFFSPPAAVTADGASAPGPTRWADVFSGAASVAPGVGSLLSAPYKSDADRASAAAARDEADAQADVRGYDQAHEDVQAADAAIQRVEQFLEQVQEAQNATRSAVASVRG